MRLYVLPISTRRTLLYCQAGKLGGPASESLTWSGRIQSKAARTWSDWENKDRGWQRAVVSYGNQLLRRIPYEEWGLKSVPPLSQRRRQAELDRSDKVEVVYPKTLLQADQVSSVLRALATEREGLHRTRLLWCLVGMPITIPVALVPLIPNLPFFYLVYRAWSHWRALAGGRHVQFLLNNNLLVLAPNPLVDAVYAAPKPPLPSAPEPAAGSAPVASPGLPPPGAAGQACEGETLLLSQAEGKKLTLALGLPQLETELERAIWQVETAIEKRKAQVAAVDDAPAAAAEAAAAAAANSTSKHESEKKSQ
ncbi:hypothetical protein VTJ83DRAFT_4193 [Remersonia thermophila]|uniref:Mitochondrial K+-H+ exchange-related-domain-containing protein n=1 Tax=Remersonia thermophila TaxID=72144 RepID=A0ABR4DAR7_9PEZI